MARAQRLKIGFWGAGLMGSGLCRNLLRQGHEVWVYSRDAERARELAGCGEYGHPCSSFADLANGTYLFTCVARPTYLEKGLLGDGAEKGLYSLLAKGSIHIECSTIDPRCAQVLAHSAEEHGLSYLQATLGKTPAMAEKAQEPIFVGGPKELQKSVWTLLESIGKPMDVGSIEASCAAKLISNLIGMTNVCVLAEGFKVGQSFGLKSDVLLALLRDTGAHSFQMDVRGPMLADDTYDDVKFRLTLALKDMVLGTDMAHLQDVPVPLFDAARTQFTIADTKGFGSLDCAAVGKRTR